jgi:hypothetical protein
VTKIYRITNLLSDDDDGSDSTVDEDSTCESKVDDETEMDTQTEVHENSPSSKYGIIFLLTLIQIT